MKWQTLQHFSVIPGSYRSTVAGCPRSSIYQLMTRAINLVSTSVHVSSGVPFEFPGFHRFIRWTCEVTIAMHSEVETKSPRRTIDTFVCRQSIKVTTFTCLSQAARPRCLFSDQCDVACQTGCNNPTQYLACKTDEPSWGLINTDALPPF